MAQWRIYKPQIRLIKTVLRSNPSPLQIYKIPNFEQITEERNLMLHIGRFVSTYIVPIWI